MSADVKASKYVFELFINGELDGPMTRLLQEEGEVDGVRKGAY